MSQPSLAAHRTDPGQLVRAVHTWSLFRTLGRYVAPDSMPSGDLTDGGGSELGLLELPGELARHGYRSAQLCHFYLARRDPDYLEAVRTAFADADVELECFLIDDGDLSHPTQHDHQREWISSWVEAAEGLGAARTRVVAGKQPPTPETLRRSADGLAQLADQHSGMRLVVENWHALLPDAASVNSLLDLTGDRIGFLVDLGNWKGAGKYAELRAVAHRAETCQAKVSTGPDGTIDEADFRSSLGVLKDADYRGPLALVYDGADPDEWGRLDEAFALARSVFEAPTPSAH